MLVLQHFYAKIVESMIGRILGGTNMLVVIVIVWRLFRNPKALQDRGAIQPERNKIVLLGLIAGYIVSLTSVGSGPLLMAGLVILYPVRSALLRELTSCRRFSSLALGSGPFCDRKRQRIDGRAVARRLDPGHPDR